MRIHELKTWPVYFEPILKNEKTFEIRKNDRDFQVNDQIVLREWDPNTKFHTGRTIFATITFITAFAQQDHVVFSFVLKKIGKKG